MISDTLRALAHTWLAPISDAAPAGDDATADERYLDLRAEVSRLERGDRVDWARVLDLGTELLQESTKDLLVAVYVAWALYQRSGFVGLTQGVALVAALLDTYGEALHPRRPRARAGALEWLLQTRCEPALAVTIATRLVGVLSRICSDNTTAGTIWPTMLDVRALYSLQNCIRFTPWGPRAVPMGGAGLALPA